MLPLTLNVLLAVVFGHMMKLAGQRNANLLWVATINYLTAGAGAVLSAAVVRPQGQLTFTIATGAWGGVCYLLSLLFYFAAIEQVGMGLATAGNRLAVAVPVAAAILVWHESLHPVQVVGLLLVAASLPLLANVRLGGAGDNGTALLRVLFPMFAITGISQLANRIFSGGAPAANEYLFLAALFGAAAISAFIALLLRPGSLRPGDVVLGASLGMVNFAVNIFLLTALRELPSAVVFSVSSGGSVLLAVLTGSLVWGETLTSSAKAGAVGAMVAVVLLTL
jgi:drug/metabolite transporter (DMT)-like permease